MLEQARVPRGPYLVPEMLRFAQNDTGGTESGAHGCQKAGSVFLRVWNAEITGLFICPEGAGKAAASRLDLLYSGPLAVTPRDCFQHA